MFQDDHRAFRRQLEDKRPIVESNLLSGRQYIANEPPLSDTSDTDGNVLAHLLHPCHYHIDTNDRIIESLPKCNVCFVLGQTQYLLNVYLWIFFNPCVLESLWDQWTLLQYSYYLLCRNARVKSYGSK